MKGKIRVITIDGPSGTGKGTISQLLAQELGWHLLDSGSLYRVLALAAKKHHVDSENEKGLAVLAGHLDVQFKATSIGSPSRVILEGQDVTKSIRTEECGNFASKISAIPLVRHALLERQREFRQSPGLVTDGRDMGTVVFPDAEIKIFLEASLDARVMRRYKQLTDKGLKVNVKQVAEDLEVRDKRDKERAVSPLHPARDAIIIDTTNLSIDEVLEKILTIVKKK